MSMLNNRVVSVGWECKINWLMIIIWRSLYVKDMWWHIIDLHLRFILNRLNRILWYQIIIDYFIFSFTCEIWNLHVFYQNFFLTIYYWLIQLQLLDVFFVRNKPTMYKWPTNIFKFIKIWHFIQTYHKRGSLTTVNYTNIFLTWWISLYKYKFFKHFDRERHL